jgi:hypothetical protein
MEGAKQTKLDRLCQAANVSTYAALAEILSVSPQSVSDAKRKGRVPNAWVIKISYNYGVSLDWLLYGREPIHSDQKEIEIKLAEEEVLCSNCIKLLQQLLQAKEREIELLNKNSVLKDEIHTLQHQLSLFANSAESKENTA